MKKITGFFTAVITFLVSLFYTAVSPTGDLSFPKAEHTARTVLLTEAPDAETGLLLGTLQGLAANAADENLVFKAGSYREWLPFTGAEILETQENGAPWDALALLERFSAYVSGYILCDEKSAAVAVSLAGLLNSVAVPEPLEPLAEDAGLPLTLDVRGKTDEWLRQSKYFQQLSRTVAVSQPASMAPKLTDYAVMHKAYFGFADSDKSYDNANTFGFLQNNAVVFGWNGPLGEFQTVTSLSRLNACLVPADHAYNLSVLSGYSADKLKQKTLQTAEAQTENVHTVCILMSDGDNLQWLLNSYTDASHYGSSLRGNFAMGWGIPAAAPDAAAPMAKALYDSMTPQDEFVLQLSGTGYTFPSKWTSKRALRNMAAALNNQMEKLDASSLLVLDDGGFNASSIDILAAQSAVKGIFYIDYSNYAGMNGKVRFSGGKPVVAARYRLWAGTEGGSPEEIAAAVNAASRDPSSADAYSFIIVHAWSGLDGDGNFGSGDTMAAVAAMTALFGDDVRVVTPAEFLQRLTALQK